MSKRRKRRLYYHLTLRVYNCNLSFLHLFFRSFSYEHWETNEERRATNVPEIFGLPWENSKSNWNAPESLRRFQNAMYTCFWAAQQVQRGLQSDESWLHEREAFNKQDWSQHRACKSGGVWQSSVDCSNNHKLAGIFISTFQLKGFETRS